MTALLEHINLSNKSSKGFLNLMPQCVVPYTIIHFFYPTIHTVLNGVLGSCSKLRSLNFIGRGVPEPLGTPCEVDVKIWYEWLQLQQVFLDTCNIRIISTILDQVSLWEDKT